MQTYQAFGTRIWGRRSRSFRSRRPRGYGHHAADGRSGGPGGDASGARAVVTVKTKPSRLEMTHLVARRQALWTWSRPLPRGRRTRWSTSSAPSRRRPRATSRATSRMSSDDMETFNVLIDEEVDTMTGKVQDDHRITEPPPRSPPATRPAEPLVPAEPVQPTDPVPPSEPIRFVDPIRREGPARFDEPVHSRGRCTVTSPSSSRSSPSTRPEGAAPRGARRCPGLQADPLCPAEPIRPSEQPAAPSAPVTSSRPTRRRRTPRSSASAPPSCTAGPGPGRARLAGAPGPRRRPQAVHRGVRPRRLPRLPPRDARSALTPSTSSAAALALAFSAVLCHLIFVTVVRVFCP